MKKEFKKACLYAICAGPICLILLTEAPRIPGWGVGAIGFTLVVLMSIGDSMREKEQEKRADALALKKHEARLRVQSERRKESQKETTRAQIAEE